MVSLTVSPPPYFSPHCLQEQWWKTELWTGSPDQIDNIEQCEPMFWQYEKTSYALSIENLLVWSRLLSSPDRRDYWNEKDKNQGEPFFEIFWLKRVSNTRTSLDNNLKPLLDWNIVTLSDWTSGKQSPFPFNCLEKLWRMHFYVSDTIYIITFE